RCAGRGPAARTPAGSSARRRRSVGRRLVDDLRGRLPARFGRGSRADLRSQHRLDLRRDLAPRLVARARTGPWRLAELLPIAAITIAPLIATVVPPESCVASAAWRRLLEPRRRAAAPAAEALPVQRGGICAASAPAPALTAARPRITLAPLREEVLGNRGFLEVLVLGDHRRPAGCGDADLRVPHGAEGGGR